MQMYKEATIAGVCVLLLAGCALFRKKEPEAMLRVFGQATTSLSVDDMRVIAVPKTGLKIPINPFAAFTENDVDKAEIKQTPGGATILLHLDASGLIQLDELTTRSRGRYIVTFLNDRPVAAWLVDKRITNGQFVVEGDFTDEDARKAVDSLNQQSKKRQAR